MNDLKRVFPDLFKAHYRSLTSYTPRQKGRWVNLPTISWHRQMTGPLLQYKFTWNQRKKDENGCPCCLHFLMMAIVPCIYHDCQGLESGEEFAWAVSVVPGDASSKWVIYFMITSPLPVLLVVIFGIVIGCKCSYKKFHHYLNPSISTMFKSRIEHLNGAAAL